MWCELDEKKKIHDRNVTETAGHIDNFHGLRTANRSLRMTIIFFSKAMFYYIRQMRGLPNNLL